MIHVHTYMYMHIYIMTFGTEGSKTSRAQNGTAQRFCACRGHRQSRTPPPLSYDILAYHILW